MTESPAIAKAPAPAPAQTPAPAHVPIPDRIRTFLTDALHFDHLDD